MSTGTPGERTALVTGASSGIGRELTKQFARDGHDVVLVSRSEEELEAFGDDLEGRHGVEATVLPADLSVPGSAREIYDAVCEEGLDVDVLVNNAGFGVYGRFTETDLDVELDMLQLNVVTVTHLTKLFAQDMADGDGGRILNNASVAGFAPVPTSAVYSATKHYVLAFSEALAEEFAGDDVTVTALCPGETDTGFMEEGNMEETAFESDDLMDPATVAEAGYEGLLNGERLVVPGLKNKARLLLKRVVPRKTYVRAAKKAWNE